MGIVSNHFKNNPRGRFHWACGIEDTFIADPHPVTGKRLDEYELTGHYDRWKSDFDLVEGLGVDTVRWGIPWYKVSPAKGSWDWSWIDEALPYLVKGKGVNVILDLMHYGTPLWMEKSYLDPDYPSHIEEYTARVIDRYGRLVSMATPYNEPHTVCEFAGNRGDWPPYLKGMAGYVAVFRAVLYGAVRQTKLLQEAGIECIHVECSGGSWAREPQYERQALVDRSLQALYWDFLTGTFTREHPIADLLMEHGITNRDIDYFATHSRTIDVMGVNFYPQFSYQELTTSPDGGMLRQNHQEWTTELEELLRSRYARYGVPMMITETSVRDNPALRSQWLRDSTALILKLRKEGMPLIGYTWFPVFDMYDWDYRTVAGEKDQFEAKFGFWNQDRIANEGAGLYREIIRQARS